MQLTENFTLEEMTLSSTAKRLRINNNPNREEIKNLKTLASSILQPIRDEFKSPIKIKSGYRNLLLNKAVGGARNSQHLKGEAADINSEDNIRLWKTIIRMIESKKITVGQLINEKNLKWIHISLPTTKKNQILTL